MQTTPRFLAATLLILLLSGCVGSGESSAAANPPAQESSAPIVAGIEQFGVDADGNGVPDRLDRYVAGMQATAEARAAASSYLELVSMLSAKALNNEPISEAMKQKVFASMNCYQLTSIANGGGEPLDLDAEFMRDRHSFRGMHALMGALNGTLARMSLKRAKACADAK